MIIELREDLFFNIFWVELNIDTFSWRALVSRTSAGTSTVDLHAAIWNSLEVDLGILEVNYWPVSSYLWIFFSITFMFANNSLQPLMNIWQVVLVSRSRPNVECLTHIVTGYILILKRCFLES